MMGRLKRAIPWVAAGLLLPVPALAGDGVWRLAILVGANDGGPDRVHLRYADDDAQAMATVLTEIGGVAKPLAAPREEPGTSW